MSIWGVGQKARLAVSLVAIAGRLATFGLLGVLSSQSIVCAQEASLWHDGRGGATKIYYNSGYLLQWQQPLGDWVDADGVKHGNTPYGRALIKPEKSGQFIDIDVTGLLRSLNHSATSVDFLLRSQGRFKITSREVEPLAPILELFVDEHLRQQMALRDTQLDTSTTKNLGSSAGIKVGKKANGIIGFSLPKGIVQSSGFKRAVLRLHLTKVYGKGGSLDVYRLTLPGSDSNGVDERTGLAAAFPNDIGIEASSRVIFHEDFESQRNKPLWGLNDTPFVQTAFVDSTHQQALSVTIPKGQNRGLNRRFRFADRGLNEPEEAYFRYYLRLDRKWDSNVSGGKLPGFAGTYGRAGWGGRKSTPEGGWSARGFFHVTSDSLDRQKITPVGNYVYHLDQSNRYGSSWIWNSQGGALLSNDRWYSVEQYIRLNTPGQADGVLRGWLNGRLVFEKEGLRLRGTTQLKIQEVWFNVYHGGGDKAPRDLTLYLDDVVIARDYIGPKSASSKNVKSRDLQQKKRNGVSLNTLKGNSN